MAEYESRDASTRDSQLAASGPIPAPDFSTETELSVQYMGNTDMDNSREFPPVAPDNTRTRFTS